MKRFNLIIIIVFLFTFSGCIEQNIKDDNKKNAYIVYNIGHLPEDLLMFNNAVYFQKDLLYALFEGLVTMDKNGAIMPALAESWSISTDGIEYTFNIREDAKWNDGTPITSEDFMKFFSEILSQKADNTAVDQLKSIYGVEDYYKGRVKFEGVAIMALDKNTLKFRLNNTCGDLLQILSQPIYGLRLNTDNLKSYKSKFSEIKYSGAFNICSYDEQEGLLIEKNKYYRNEQLVTDDKVLIVENSSIETALADFESFKIDILTNPPTSEVKRVINGDNTIIVNTADKIGLAFNMSDKSIARDINFRKAIKEIVDAEEIADKALSEYSIINNNDMDDINVFKNNSLKKVGDVTSGIQYMESIKKDNMKSLQLICLNNDINKRIAKSLAASIKEHFGLTLVIKTYNQTTLLDALKNLDFDILLTDYSADYDKELSILNKWETKSKNNVTKYSNNEFDSMLIKANREIDKAKRKINIIECDKILKEDIPVIYLYNYLEIIACSKNILGVDLNVFGNIDFKSISKIKNDPQ